MVPLLISKLNAWSIERLALSLSAAFTPTQIECSDELCVMRITFTDSFASDSNNLLEKPGIPTMPLPSKLSKLTLLILEIPRIKLSVTADSFSINVPYSSGAKVFLIHTGIFLLITGWIVGG